MKKNLPDMTNTQIKKFLAAKEEKLGEAYFAASEVMGARGLVAETERDYKKAIAHYQKACSYARMLDVGGNGGDIMAGMYLGKIAAVRQRHKEQKQRDKKESKA